MKPTLTHDQRCRALGALLLKLRTLDVETFDAALEVARGRAAARTRGDGWWTRDAQWWREFIRTRLGLALTAEEESPF